VPRKLITTNLGLCDQSKSQPSWFDRLSDDALIRLERIIKTRGNSYPLVDASRSTWWRWVAAGKAPKPVRPTQGSTMWRVRDLRAWLRDPEQFKPIAGHKTGVRSTS
jgi:predicted DNA-binding transcriptional regulator AlpA